jgi:hypothetical protein
MPSGDMKLSTTTFTPSLQVTLKSVLFMTYLLSRRHELTPDFFHFATCFNEDLQHMLWLWLLWIYQRNPTCRQDLIMATIELVIANLLSGSFEGAIF